MLIKIYACTSLPWRRQGVLCFGVHVKEDYLIALQDWVILQIFFCYPYQTHFFSILITCILDVPFISKHNMRSCIKNYHDTAADSI